MANIAMELPGEGLIPFMKSVGDELEKRKHKVYFFAFDPRLRVSAKQCQVTKLYPTREELPLGITGASGEINIEQALHLDYLEKEIGHSRDLILHRAKVLADYFYAFFQENEIDLLFVWNGFHLVAGVAAGIAECCYVDTVFGENGFFQDTLQIDKSGVNSGNSLAVKNRAFYDDLEIDRQRYQKFVFQYKHPQAVSHPYSLNSIPLSTLEQILFGIYRRTPWHKQKYPESTPKTLLPQTFLQQIYKKYFVAEDAISLPEEFIFVPLQVGLDTQILIRSDQIQSMEHFVETIYQAAQKAENGLPIVVKEHPADIGRVSYHSLRKRYPDIIWLRKYDLRALLQKASLVITVNSTVGVEALLYHKAVIALGEAFYNVEDVVYHCSSLDKLANIMDKALQKRVDEELIDKFLYFLRFDYLIPGTWRDPKAACVNLVANKLEEQLG
jgi:capsule polysaccharide modification protein KpsS